MCVYACVCVCVRERERCVCVVICVDGYMGTCVICVMNYVHTCVICGCVHVIAGPRGRGYGPLPHLVFNYNNAKKWLLLIV